MTTHAARILDPGGNGRLARIETLCGENGGFFSRRKDKITCRKCRDIQEKELPLAN